MFAKSLFDRQEKLCYNSTLVNEGEYLSFTVIHFIPGLIDSANIYN